MKCPYCDKDIAKGLMERQKRIALYLIKEGFADRAIARLLGDVSYTTIGRWRKNKRIR